MDLRDSDSIDVARASGRALDKELKVHLIVETRHEHVDVAHDLENIDALL